MKLRHYKGGIYKLKFIGVLTTNKEEAIYRGFHTENERMVYVRAIKEGDSPDDYVVVYYRIKDAVVEPYVRPLPMFFMEIDGGLRFTLED